LYYIYNRIDQCCITWLRLFIVSLGTSGCVNSCENSPEDGPVGPKHVEIRQCMNKIEIVTSVGFYSICWKDARYKKLKIMLCAYTQFTFHMYIWPAF